MAVGTFGGGNSNNFGGGSSNFGSDSNNFGDGRNNFVDGSKQLRRWSTATSAVIAPSALGFDSLSWWRTASSVLILASVSLQ